MINCFIFVQWSFVSPQGAVCRSLTILLSLPLTDSQITGNKGSFEKYYRHSPHTRAIIFHKPKTRTVFQIPFNYYINFNLIKMNTVCRFHAMTFRLVSTLNQFRKIDETHSRALSVNLKYKTNRCTI